MADDHQDFEQQLPWLVNQSLSDPEKSALQEQLKQSEKMQQEHEFLQQLRQTLKTQAENQNSPGEMGYQRLLQNIKKEKSRAGRAWQWLAIAACLLVVVQTPLVLQPQWNPVMQLQSGNNQFASEGIRLQVVFKPEVTMERIVDLLSQMQANIVEGPSSRGVFMIRFPKEKSVQHWQSLLEKEPMVLQVSEP